ncbi:MAG: nucleoside deaminase, partial [Bacteroidota bacterium]
MTDEHFMQLALKEAQKAFNEGEVPVGAVITINN